MNNKYKEYQCEGKNRRGDRCEAKVGSNDPNDNHLCFWHRK